jgi:putative ABC transport system permease protein
MSWVNKLRNLFRSERMERELDEELRAHVEMRVEENIAAGMTPQEARNDAQRRFGNFTLQKEDTREIHVIGWLETTMQDLRYAVRIMRRSPGFTVVAVLTLALGIGANTAIFELLNAVLLRSLPVKNPQELAEVRNVVRKPRTGNFDGRRPELTYPQWTRIREQQEGFSAVAAWFAGRVNLSTSGVDRFANNTLWVSGEFFNVLGVGPLLGRTFTTADDQRGCSSAGAVISYPFWQREFGGDPSAVGRKITLNGHPFEVLGVTPANFFGVEVGRQFDLAIPLCADTLLNPERKRFDRLDSWWLAAIGRLKPGWTVERASAQLTAISPALYEETLFPGYNPEDAKNYLALRLGAVPAANGVSGLRTAFGTPLWLLLAGSGVVLLIACANLANLMLVRASARDREIAMRLALGASRRRLVRQMLTESLLLAVLGTAAGAWLARELSQFIVSLMTIESSARFLDLSPDWRMISFTAGMAMLTCVLFGLAPALRATRTAPAGAMNAGSRGTTSSRERSGLRRTLVVSQIALCLVLLVCSMLFGRTLQNLLTLDAGFQQEGIYELDARLRVPKERRSAQRKELLERLRNTPGVEAAATSNYVPLSGNFWDDNVLVDSPTGERKADVQFDRVSPGYFNTLRIALLRGRDFNSGDTTSSPLVAIVNESFAKKFFDGADPVGKIFRIEEDAGVARPNFEIVGLVKDTKYGDLRTDFAPISYFPAQQAESPGSTVLVLIRTALTQSSLTPAVKRAVEETDPAISFHVTSFKMQIRESLLQERLMATLTGFFGALAAVLASIGLYGVLSFTVARRTNEIGIRLALGASRENVLRMVLKESLWLVLAGIALGLPATLAAAQATRTMLYGLDPADPLTVSLAVLLLGTVALLASYLPARRAMKVDPMVALRYE